MTLTKRDLNEEIEFFRDICGWNEHKIEAYLGLGEGTLAQRRHRAARRERQARGEPAPARTSFRKAINDRAPKYEFNASNEQFPRGTHGPSGMPYRFTEAEEKIIAQRYVDGESGNAIARDYYKCSPDTIIQICRRQGVTIRSNKREPGSDYWRDQRDRAALRDEP